MNLGPLAPIMLKEEEKNPERLIRPQSAFAMNCIRDYVLDALYSVKVAIWSCRAAGWDAPQFMLDAYINGLRFIPEDIDNLKNGNEIAAQVYGVLAEPGDVIAIQIGKKQYVYRLGEPSVRDLHKYGQIAFNDPVLLKENSRDSFDRFNQLVFDREAIWFMNASGGTGYKDNEDPNATITLIERKIN